MSNKVDFEYCASSFLMYRTIIDKSRKFYDNVLPNIVEIPEGREVIKNSEELYKSLKRQVENVSRNRKVALALSGGIDSAILAKFLPKNTMTYTFKCVVPGKKVTDETERAKKYANECNLKNKVIEIYWEDFEKYTPILMKNKGAPIHSIEVQIYKAALQAKKDGVDTLIFGESADCLYGGLSNILSRDWTFGEFIDRYSFVLPYKVLKKYNMDLTPIMKYTKKDGYIDVQGFYGNVFFKESINSYYNACETAGIECYLPFANTIMGVPLDLKLVREGNNKYLIRDVFKTLYEDFEVPPKTPMPRPMNEWFEKWEGPNSNMFYPKCALNMSGDQKWLIWSLNTFININEKNLST